MAELNISKELRSSVELAEEARRQRIRTRLREANDVAFKRACEAEGIDPAGGVSPGLLATLGVRGE